MSKEPETLKEAAMWYSGVEVHKDQWEEAEAIVKAEPENFSLGHARGPDKAWRRLYYHDEEVIA